jgi:hypothetical protein
MIDISRTRLRHPQCSAELRCAMPQPAVHGLRANATTQRHRAELHPCAPGSPPIGITRWPHKRPGSRAAALPPTSKRAPAAPTTPAWGDLHAISTGTFRQGLPMRARRLRHFCIFGPAESLVL